MLKLPDNKDDALAYAELALEGLNMINGLVGAVSPSTAAGAITVIRLILATIQEGFDEKITPERVREEFAKFTASIGANDASADAALEEKFNKKD